MVRKLLILAFLIKMQMAFGMERMERAEHLVNLDFINATGYELTINTLLEGERVPEVARQITLVDKNLREPNKLPQVSLKLQNLYLIKNYEINFKSPGYFSKPLIIDAKRLDQELFQARAHEAKITITYSRLYGLQPTISYFSLKTTEPKISSESSLKESKWEFTPERGREEREEIYKALDVLPGAEPYRVLGLKIPPPKAMQGVEPSRQSRDVQLYLNQLREKYERRLQEWPINQFLDFQKEKESGIQDFTKKVRDLIEVSYGAVLSQMGVK